MTIELQNKYNSLKQILKKLGKVVVTYSGVTQKYILRLERSFPVIGDFVRKNFYLCIFWGIILQIAGGLLRPLHNYPKTFPNLIIFGYLIYLIGIVLMLLGFFFYVKSKHRHWLWCLFALLPIIGWIVLILLKSKYPLPLSKENS